MTLNNIITQYGILQPIPAHARFLTFTLKPNGEYAEVLRKLAPLIDGDKILLGVGLCLVQALNKQCPGLRDFPVFPEAKVALPVNKLALWCWLRESERGRLVKQMQRLLAVLETAFELDSCVDAFKFDTGRDLTGYEDGTENPQGQAAVDAAIVHQSTTDGQASLTSPTSPTTDMNGGSFVAVQQWLHLWDRFKVMTTEQRDNAIGRRLSDNEELEEAPESAHVKRTAQESFDPEAFIVRRSMPWSLGAQSGFYFVAFGRSLDAFEVQLKRMSGADDGIVDGLFQFSQPQTGSYFWCPPMQNGQVNLASLLD